MDDEEQRRRRKHFRSAGAPYSGGTQSQPHTQVPQYETQVEQKPGRIPDYDVEIADAPGAAAPRQAAAVDLGAGPVQPQHVTPTGPPRDFRERQYSPDMPDRMTNIVADLQAQKQRAAALFEEDEPATAHPLVATGGMPPGRPGKGGPDEEDDPRAPRPRIPRRDPQPLAPSGPRAPQGPPAGGRPTPAPAPEVLLQKRPVLLPEPVRPRRGLGEIGPTPVSQYGRVDPMSGTARRVPFGPQTGVKRRMVPRRTPPGQPYGGGGGQPPGGGGPPGPPGGGFGPVRAQDKGRKKRVRFGKDELRLFHEGRAIQSWDPSEQEKRRGYQQYGQMQGRKLAQREHQITLEKIQKKNRNLVLAMRKRGGEQIGARDQRLAQMQQAGEVLEARIGAGSQQLSARDRKIAAMQQTGEVLEARVRAGSKQLTARDTALTKKQARINALLQEGRSLDVAGRREVGKLRAEISRLQRAGASLLQEGGVLQARVAAGAKQLGERDQRLAAMQQEGGVLKARVAAGTKQLGARDQRMPQPVTKLTTIAVD